MNNIFMNLENSNISKPHVLILKSVALLYQILVFITHGKT